MSGTIVNTPPFSGAFKRPLIGGSGGNSGNSNSTVKKPPVEKGGGSIRAEDPWEASLVRCHPCGVVIPATSLRNHFRVKHPHLPGYKGMITFLKKTYCRYSGRQRIQ